MTACVRQVSPIIGVDGYDTRVEITLSLMLTAVAFKLATADLLPVLPYNTVLGMHMLIGIVSLGVMMIMHCVEEIFQVSQRADNFIHAMLFAAWVLYHSLLIHGIWRRAKTNAEKCGPPITVDNAADTKSTQSASTNLQHLLFGK